MSSSWMGVVRVQKRWCWETEGRISYALTQPVSLSFTNSFHVELLLQFPYIFQARGLLFAYEPIRFLSTLSASPSLAYRSQALTPALPPSSSMWFVTSPAPTGPSWSPYTSPRLRSLRYARINRCVM